MGTTGRGTTPALIVVLLLTVGGLIGYWVARPRTIANPSSPAVGTTGTLSPHQESAREKGREVGERVAVATEKVKENVTEASLTAKIKAKMALDDSVKARAIDVTTNGTTVTLSGTVRSATEHDRAVALARETGGITHVVDRLTVR
jgi:hyperosmotically inducible periplasmic protein